jgi:hypothetical protein
MDIRLIPLIPLSWDMKLQAQRPHIQRHVHVPLIRLSFRQLRNPRLLMSSISLLSTSPFEHSSFSEKIQMEENRDLPDHLRRLLANDRLLRALLLGPILSGR